MLKRSIPKQISTIEIFIFLITMSFAPQYLIIDIRPLIYAFWILLSLSRGTYFKEIRITNYAKLTITFLFLISIYSMLVVLFSSSGNHYIYMRYIRSLIALMVIIFYLSTVKLDITKLINSFILVLFLHSTIIIGEIIFPQIKDVMYPFSGMSRKFYEYRANGLVNSYDLAGIYSNLGLLLSSLKYIQTRKKNYLLMSIICLTAVIFTSRLNIFAMLLVLAFILKKSIECRIKIFSMLIFILLIISGALGIFTWVITTDAFPILKEFILGYDWANNFYFTIRSTYSDDDIANLLGHHFNMEINSASTFLFGLGIEGNFDPGYTKLFYSLGFIGVASIVMYYLNLLYYILKVKFLNFFSNEYLIYVSLIFIMMVMLIGNFKILYFFSTSLFELVSILLISYELTKRQPNKDNL